MQQKLSSTAGSFVQGTRIAVSPGMVTSQVCYDRGQMQQASHHRLFLERLHPRLRSCALLWFLHVTEKIDFIEGERDIHGLRRRS